MHNNIYNILSVMSPLQTPSSSEKGSNTYSLESTLTLNMNSSFHLIVPLSASSRKVIIEVPSYWLSFLASYLTLLPLNPAP